MRQTLVRTPACPWVCNKLLNSVVPDAVDERALNRVASDVKLPPSAVANTRCDVVVVLWKACTVINGCNGQGGILEIVHYRVKSTTPL